LEQLMMAPNPEYWINLRLSPYGTWVDLPEPIAAELFAHAKPRRLKTGDMLFEVGESGNGFYLLDEGLLKVILTSSDDEEEVIIALLPPGAIVGDLAVIDEMPRAASVGALLDCRLRFVSKADFNRCAGKYPEIYRYLAKMLATRLRETNQSLAAHTLLTVKGRVARVLLEIAQILGRPSGDGISFPDAIHQKHLAAMAGVARETVNRILHDWETKKIVTKTGHSYFIADVTVLERER
jgi:CRP/FNR family transcriptional regulator, cyclic AMP receptor protein